MLDRVLVTGGTGLVGHSMLKIRPKFIYAGSRDCNLVSRGATYAFIASHDPDAIIHLAATVNPLGASSVSPRDLLCNNMRMGENVLDAARACGVKRVVMCLSSGMYSGGENLSEDDIHKAPPHPSNYAYAFAKRIMEPLVRAYREDGLDGICVIPNGIYGESQMDRPHHQFMIPSLIRRLAKGDYTIWGDGSQRREYTYADDAAAAIVWCLEHDLGEQVALNIGCTESHTIREVAYMMADELSIDRNLLVFDPTKPAGVDRLTNNSRFLALSHFQYTPFAVGLQRTIKYYLCESF